MTSMTRKNSVIIVTQCSLFSGLSKKKKKGKLNIHKESEENVRKLYKERRKSSQDSIWIVSHVQHKLSYIEQLTMDPVRLSINNKLFL